MNSSERTLKELSEKASSVFEKSALVGLDGFVDKIVRPVDQRSGQGENYTPLKTISAFAERIADAAGKSTNIELAPVVDKLGGNGPIMANAQRALGIKVRYIGALGDPEIHPVFKQFAEQTEAVSLVEPGITHAAEFTDGKIMLGSMASMDLISYEQIITKMGEGAFLDAFSRADLIAMVNWTMIPNMSSIFNAFLDRVLAHLPPHDNRVFFFDLADPQKRSRGDISNVLKIISRFQSHGHAILGLNLKEAQQVDAILGFSPLGAEPEDLKKMASRIRNQLKIGTVVVHPSTGAACATRDESVYVKGPYTEDPKITTGAGDHFNAGFVTARMLGLSPEASLTMAVATSGLYVRTAKSPSIGEIESFIQTW